MRTALTAFALFVCLARSVTAAPPLQLSRVQIEAAYLYNFARFVEWPASAFADAQAPLVVGVIGKDPFGSLLDDLVTGEKINGRSLVIRRFARVQDIAGCHILFIPRSEAQHCAQICAALQNRRVLTVSDIPGFARQGGMIELLRNTNASGSASPSNARARNSWKSAPSFCARPLLGNFPSWVAIYCMPSTPSMDSPAPRAVNSSARFLAKLTGDSEGCALQIALGPARCVHCAWIGRV